MREVRLGSRAEGLLLLTQAAGSAYYRVVDYVPGRIVVLDRKLVGLPEFEVLVRPVPTPLSGSMALARRDDVPHVERYEAVEIQGPRLGYRPVRWWAYPADDTALDEWLRERANA